MFTWSDETEHSSFIIHLGKTNAWTPPSKSKRIKEQTRAPGNPRSMSSWYWILIDFENCLIRFYFNSIVDDYSPVFLFQCPWSKVRRDWHDLLSPYLQILLQWPEIGTCSLGWLVGMWMNCLHHQLSASASALDAQTF